MGGRAWVVWSTLYFYSGKVVLLLQASAANQQAVTEAVVGLACRILARNSE